MYFRGIGTDNICEIPANILDKRAFFHYSRIQKKAVKKRSRRGWPTEREAYKLEGFPGTEALKVALEPEG